MPVSAITTQPRAVVTLADLPLKVLVVDQSNSSLAAVRNALAGSVDLQLVADTGYGPVSLTSARECQPDLIVVAADEPLIRAIDTIQLLTSVADAPWVVVAVATRDDADLLRKLMLAGVRDVLLRTWSPGELRVCLQTAHRAGSSGPAASASGPAHGAVGSIITVFGDKGGVGKTTLATNLALALAGETSRSVALVDLDLPHGDIAILLNLSSECSVAAAMSETVLADPLILQAHLATGPAGLRVLSGSMSADAPNVAIAGSQVTELLTRLAQLHDYVVVDTPPGINEFSAAALDVASLALLVTTPELPCLRRTRTCLDSLRTMGYSPDRVKVLLNRTSSKTSIDEEQVRGVIDQPIWWRVSNDHAVLAAAATGRPVVLAEPNAPLASDIRGLARQIGNIDEPKQGRWTRLLAALGIGRPSLTLAANVAGLPRGGTR
jgi:pilus assembly protein CpaE